MEVLPFLFLGLSILAIGKGSDWLTDSLIPIARKLGVSGSSVGLILVSAAVSLPEVLVALFASLHGYSSLSLGVILGSIICNIGLMTGLSALVRPLKVNKTIILRDGVFSIVVPILVFAVSTGGEIARIEGVALTLLFIPYVINVFLQERKHPVEKEVRRREVEKELELIGFEFGDVQSPWLSFGLGLVLLLGGAQLFSNQLIYLATQFGINELLIGITIGALGPSIPNIMAAYSATKKGMGEVAVSETLGSNIFTLLVTLGVIAMFSPIIISPQWLSFDIPVLIGMSFLLFIFLLTKDTISKYEGMILLGGYVGIVLIQIAMSIL